MTIWICRWRMNTLVTSQYQPRLSSITNIFPRRISQSDWNIQIKLNYYKIKFILNSYKIAFNSNPNCQKGEWIWGEHSFIDVDFFFFQIWCLLSNKNTEIILTKLYFRVEIGICMGYLWYNFHIQFWFLFYLLCPIAFYDIIHPLHISKMWITFHILITFSKYECFW